MQKASSQLRLAISLLVCSVFFPLARIQAAPAELAVGAVTPRAGTPVGAAAAQPPAATPFDQEVSERRTRFEKEAALPQSPAAVTPLLGLAELWENVDDRPAWQKLVELAAQPRPTLSPLVRAQALWTYRQLLWHRGQNKEASAVASELGLVTAFAITGPFDNDGHRGHAAVYPPEGEAAAPSPESRYEGKNPSVPLRWRVLPEKSLARDGSVPLDAWLRPDSQGTAYALCYVRSDKPQRVAVRIGTTGAVKVWVNRGGKPVIDRDLYHPIHPDQEVGGAMLLAGWNRLLVKVSNTEGRWAFVVRLTAPDGRPLAGLTTSADPPSPDWTIPRAVAYAGAPPSNLLALLRARVPRLAAGAKLAPGSAAARSRAEALLDLGLYLHYITPFDPETREDEQVVGEAVALAPSRRAYRLLALVTGEVNRERSSVEAGLALPGEGEPDERARLLYELGRIYDEGQRQRQAEQAYAEAARLRSALYPATLALAQLQAHRGLTSEAIRLTSELHEHHKALRVRRALADLLGRAGRHAESEALYTALLADSQDDQDAARQLLSRARARGDVEQALAWLDKLATLAPEAVWVPRERVELMEGAGQKELALAAASAVMTQLGGDADWHQLRGRLLVALGRTELAIKEYQSALAIKPQNPSLRSYLQHLDPQARSGDDLARSFRLDLPALLARPRPKPAAGDPARVLLDQKVTRVHKNGLSEVYTQRAIEILDEHGAAEYGEIDIRYTPDTQSVQIKSAKLYRSTGEVQESVAQQESNVSEPWYGLYYDVHAQSVRFDGLRPGDVVALEYVLADVGRRNLLSDYFGDLHFMQEEIPRLDSRYTLVLPEEDLRRRPLYFNDPRGGDGFAKGGRLPGQIELNGRIAHGDAGKIARYLPLHMAQTRQYLGRALRGGTVQDASFRVKGDLWDFPFNTARSPKDGEFRIAGRVKDATFDYVPSEPAVNEKPAWVSPWPALTRVAAVPAGLLGVKSDLQVGAMHSEFFAGIAKYDHIGLAKTIDSNSVIGVSFIRFGVDNIPNTIDLIDNAGNLNYDRITSFSAPENTGSDTYSSPSGRSTRCASASATSSRSSGTWCSDFSISARSQHPSSNGIACAPACTKRSRACGLARFLACWRSSTSSAVTSLAGKRSSRRRDSCAAPQPSSMTRGRCARSTRPSSSSSSSRIRD